MTRHRASLLSRNLSWTQAPPCATPRLRCLGLPPLCRRSSAQFRGEYLGIVQPSARCSNERWTVNIYVTNDGNFYGSLHDYDTVQTNYFKGELAYGGKWNGATAWDVFAPDFDPLSPLAGWRVKLSANAKTGTIRGTIDGRQDGYCVYTFTAYRRFKVAQ